ncbi:hypothetical protein pipiens_020089 [Culex pipiens pipiens]|uniref:Uncharacterized protein n=1 Tax=Culex pipiens pipiens TaxID=38569 RepID=A0ABD1DWC3_CULPP
MTSPAAGGIPGGPYRGTGYGYAPTQQAYRYTAPLAAQPAYATYTPHTTTTVRAPEIFFALNII